MARQRKGIAMAGMRCILGDEHSAIRARHAAIASVVAVASVAAGIFLTILGNQLYEQAGQRTIWALAAGSGVTGV
jgi:hypothetical protein